MTGRGRRVGGLVAAAATASVVALTGCSSDQRTTSPESAIARASESSDGQTPGSGDAPEETSSPALTQGDVDTGEEVDADALRERIKSAIEGASTTRTLVTAEAGETTITSGGNQNLQNGDLDLEIDQAGTKVNYRYSDGTYYVGQGDTWTAVDEDSNNAGDKIAIQQATAMRLETFVDALLSGMTAAGDKGEDEVDGVDTQRYAMTVDTAKAMEAIGQQKGADQPESIVFDVWLDDDDQVRRLDVDLGAFRATITATDWGEPFTVEVPDTGGEG